MFAQTTLADDGSFQAPPDKSTVLAAMWPTRSLSTDVRWFDELYVWTEGDPTGTMQRARIQLTALRDAFTWLEYDLVKEVGVTLSFGTVERSLDELSQIFNHYAGVSHRISIMLRGTARRVRSPYRVRAFADLLRDAGVSVGYRLSAPRISMEMAGVALVQPEFTKIIAPTTTRFETWQDLALEVRALGLATSTAIVAGIEAPQQRPVAVRAGFSLGQGHAVRSPYPPPVNPATAWRPS